MGIPSRSDLVVVSFPFSDLSGVKLRPALVVAAADNGDLILCQVTSQNYHRPAIEIDPQADVLNSKLRETSFARPLKLFAAHNKLIKGAIGKISDGKLDEVAAVIIKAITSSD